MLKESRAPGEYSGDEFENTSPLIYWTKELAVGVAEIDEQHQELFARVNSLMMACRNGCASDETLRLLDFLHSYVAKHFTAEEAIMERFEYPVRERHRQAHQSFCTCLDRLEHALAIQPEPEAILSHVNEMVVDWLFEHVCMEDRRLGGFLLDQGLLGRNVLPIVADS